MLSVNWKEVCAHPVATLKIVCLASLRSIQALLQVCFAPSTLQPLGLRNSIARTWLGLTFAIQGSILYSEPPNHGQQTVETSNFKAYVIPSTPLGELRRADAVVLYAHGGGMIFGHPLQYLKTYRRWASHSHNLGKHWCSWQYNIVSLLRRGRCRDVLR